MYEPNFSDDRLTPGSIRLWEQHAREYVEAVNQASPSPDAIDGLERGWWARAPVQRTSRVGGSVRPMH